MPNFNYEDVGAYRPRTEASVRVAFYRSGLRREAESYQVTFEHGQYWVTELGTGRAWAAHATAEGGWDFEVVSDGEE